MEIQYFVFALAGLLTIACFMPSLASRLGLPHTVTLAILGGALGLIVQANGIHWPFIGDFLHALHGFSISSQTFLIVFLPILLFETSMAMNVRRIMVDISPILTMAIVAVLVCTVSVGMIMAEFSGYSLAVCLLLGAIVATTDPVAVVGIFREVGAPKRLTTLVEGESLLNDAAAIALYTVFISVITRDAPLSIENIAGHFLYSFLIGGFIGFIFGHITCRLFHYMRGWPTAEISLTICTAYLTFFISEHYFHVSGVVATVVAGLVVGSAGRTRMSPSTFEQLGHAWEQFGFWANSLIFILAAMLIPRLVVDLDFKQTLLVVLLFITTLVARAAVVFGVIPLLTMFKMSTYVSRPFRAVMCWGGLRGAISLALALAVTEQTAIPADVRHFVAAATTCYVLATLLINGLTLRPLISKLGLDQLSPVEQGLRNQALVIALDDVKEQTDELAGRLKMEASAKQQVDAIFAKGMADIQKDETDYLSKGDRLSVALAIISNREEELFFDSLKKQLIPWQAAQTLLSNAENLGDAARAGGARAYTRALRYDIRYTSAFKIALRMQTNFNFSPWLAHELSQRIIKLISKHSVVSQLVRFCRDDLTPLLGQEIAGKAERILVARLHTIDNALSALNLTYPVYAHWTQEDYLARIARSLEVTRYNEMLEQSLITKEVYNNLIAQVNQRWEPLFRHPSLDVSLSAKELVKRVPLFEEMDDTALTQLSKLLRPRLMLPNQTVPQVDRYGHKLMFFVASGAVLITLPDSSRVELGSGEMLGELSMLTDKTLTQSVRSMGYSKLLFLQARDFHALMKKFPDIKEKIDLVVKQRLRALEVWEQYAKASSEPDGILVAAETAAAPGGISGKQETDETVRAAPDADGTHATADHGGDSGNTSDGSDTASPESGLSTGTAPDRNDDTADATAHPSVASAPAQAPLKPGRRDATEQP